MLVTLPRYGRHLADFEVGQTYAHPFEVTVDEGTIALYQATFLDATPLHASRRYARALGFRERPAHSLLAMNLALSFSVHDVSEQCIAHLGYQRMGFCRPLYPQTTVHARSTCLALAPSTGGRHGVVTVRTALFDDDDLPLCWFERQALVPEGRVAGRPPDPFVQHVEVHVPEQELPSELLSLPHPPVRDFGFGGFFEDFELGQVFAHPTGRTLGESEHLMLTSLFRNTHPLHVDARFAAEGGSFTGKPLVMGGLVFAFTIALASRDVAGQALWDLGYTDGAHVAPVHAGDTLYAATEVLGLSSLDERYGVLTLRHIALKNVRPEVFLASEREPFAAERDKDKPTRLKDKVFEVTRRLLVRRRPAAPA